MKRLLGITKKHTWQEFRKRFDAEYLTPRKTTNAQTAAGVGGSLKHFDRICKPTLLGEVNEKMLRRFVAERQKETWRNKPISAATVNKEIDMIRLVLKRAQQWGWLSDVPDVPRLDEAKRLVRFILPDDFLAIYRAAKTAEEPCHPDALANYRYEVEHVEGAYVPLHPAARWWRGLLVTTVALGWYPKEVLLLRWEGIDLDAGIVSLRVADTEGRRKRPKRGHLPPVAAEHLRRLGDYTPDVFITGDSDLPSRWLKGDRFWLWQEFRDIQKAAGINLACPQAGKHECTESCHLYSLDDLRNCAGVEACAGMLDKLAG